MQLFSSLLFPKPKSDSMTRESNISCGEQGRWSLTKEYNMRKSVLMQEPTLTCGQCRKWQNELNAFIHSFIIIFFIYVRSALFCLWLVLNLSFWKEITWKLISDWLLWLGTLHTMIAYVLTQQKKTLKWTHRSWFIRNLVTIYTTNRLSFLTRLILILGFWFLLVESKLVLFEIILEIIWYPQADCMTLRFHFQEWNLLFDGFHEKGIVIVFI